MSCSRMPVLASLCGLAFLGLSVLPSDALAQNRRKPAVAASIDDAEELKNASPRVYKKVGNTELKLWVFQPEGLKGSDRRPAIVFFFGGGWTSGSPTQFAPHCRYLASRGMVAITADYRVKSRQDSTVEQSTADALSAIRYVRAHAAELGIDPERIAAGGGSAGGHLAACTGTLDGADEPGEDKSISSRANALVLFNPALVLPSLKSLQKAGDPKKLSTRFSGDPEAVSPAAHIKAGQPPAIIFHGTADTTVPIATAKEFCNLSVKAGNRCELVASEGDGHGFFNWNRKPKGKFVETLTKTDQFLASLGWIEGPPRVKEFFGPELR